MQLGSLCTKYNVIVVADEIHSDIIYADHTHTPFASLSEELAERTITCMAQVKHLISLDYKHRLLSFQMKNSVKPLHLSNIDKASTD